MSAPSGAAVASPLLERLGVRYFRRLSASLPPVEAADAINILNPEERRALRSIAQGAVLRACLAGALCGVATAAAYILAQPLLGADPDAAGWEQRARHWVVVGGLTVLASVLEIAFLYWDSLRSVHRLARAAGLELFPEGEPEERAAVAAALARAALELPNPAHAAFGVDPRREASRLRLLLASVLYKTKVSLTSFLAKVFVRRVLGRALVRAWLPFVAIPVTATWTGVVMWIVLREARIRTMGPSAAKELVAAVFEEGIPPSPQGRLALARAAASAIVRTTELHPNLLAVLVEVLRRTGDPGEALDDSRAFLAMLPRLPPAEQRMALQIVTVAAIIDGRFTAAERRLLRDAQAACGRVPDARAAERLRRAFVAGDASLEALVRSFG